MISDIVTSKRTVLPRGTTWGDVYHLPGLLLTMKDGAIWFHPFNGSKPINAGVKD